MGISTDGILVYGVDFDEEMPKIFEDFDDGVDLGEYLREEANIPEWSEDFEEKHGYSYFEKVRKLEDACPVDVVTHCSDGCNMYVMAVRGYNHCASRGYPKEINMDDLFVEQKKITAFMNWMKNHDMECESPKWLLCSYWG